MSHPIAIALVLCAAVTFLAAEEGHHHGNEVVLGTKAMGQWQVTANRVGEFTPGKAGAATVDLVPATPAAKSVRVWIGREDGKGSTKSKGEAETEHPGGWHCHVEVPKEVTEDSNFWVTIETEAGEQLKESFPLPAAKAGHDHGGKPHKH